MTLDFLRFHIIIASFHLHCMRNFEFIHIINYIIEKEIHIFVHENNCLCIWDDNNLRAVI